MLKNEKRSMWIFGVLSLALVVFIFTRSLKPAELSSEESGVFTAFLRSLLEPSIALPDDMWETIVRKTAHFCEFAALGFCVKGYTASLGDLRGENYRSLPLLICLSVCVCDEFLQMFMPGRSCEVKDAILDFSGAAAGTLVMVFCRKLLRKKQ